MTATRHATLGATPANVEWTAGEESGVAGSAARATASPQGAVPLTRTADRQTPNIPRRAAV
ncbi:hypothetical protein ACFV2U_37345 [Streptomyces sp. NPDC059697]|uniref:hypothetical protein n=1 Tax=Streptomyces sp. NPDC059697 TaxID=3346912 RepID=UPI003696B125